MNFKECVLDSVLYWERKRIEYNGVLVMLVLVCWGSEVFFNLPPSAAAWFHLALLVALFAAIANVLYCAAYPFDIAMQLTLAGTHWRRFRWALFIGGTSLASLLAIWVMLGAGMG